MNSLYPSLLSSVEQFSSNDCLVYKENEVLITLSYQDLLAQVNQVASFLRQQGLKKDDRLAFISPKSYKQVVLFYAAWQIGLIAVPISEGLAPDERQFILEDADPALVLYHDTLIELRDQEAPKALLFSEVFLSGSADGPSADFTDSNSLQLVAEDPSDLLQLVAEDPRRNAEQELCDPGKADETAALIYTSGSTGMPKGVMLSHRNLLVNAQSSAELLPLTENDRFLSMLPYWHSFALVAEVVMTSLNGACTVIPKDRRDFSKNLPAYGATIILVVPRMLSLFRGSIENAMQAKGAMPIFDACLANAKQYFSDQGQISEDQTLIATRQQFSPLLDQIKPFFGPNFRFFIGGGAPLDIAYQRFFQALGLPVFQGYGLTESSPVISCNGPEDYLLGSSGRLLPWLEEKNGGDYIFVDNEGNKSKEIEGELLVKGDCVMQGYWRHQDESAKTLADGWLHTGDMGYMKNGYLYLTGRQSNLICLKGGEKLHPEFVEDKLKNHPQINEAMLIGEGCKNVYALINISDEAPERSSREWLKELQTELSELNAYQKPKSLLIVPAFNIEEGTMTPTLKIRRKQITTQYSVEIFNFLHANNETFTEG